MNARKLRWRLARAIAPVGIIASPGEEDGAYVVILEGRSQMSIKADTFRLRHTAQLAPLDFTSTDPVYRPHKRGGKFVGTF